MESLFRKSATVALSELVILLSITGGAVARQQQPSVQAFERGEAICKDKTETLADEQRKQVHCDLQNLDLAPVPATADAARKPIYLEGALERFEYTYPNIVISVAVKKAGRMQHWVVQTWPPNEAEKVGWSQEMMKPGDHIKYEVIPEGNGELAGWGGNIITVNGKKIGTLTQPERVTILGY